MPSATILEKVCLEKVYLLGLFSDILWKIVLESRAFGQNTWRISSNLGGLLQLPGGVHQALISTLELNLFVKLLRSEDSANEATSPPNFPWARRDRGRWCCC
jgi:hypothetical protein